MKYLQLPFGVATPYIEEVNDAMPSLSTGIEGSDSED